MAKITKRAVDALRPMPGRDVFLWDDELRGFGVRCRPSGAKVYVLKYRTIGGRQRWLTLGAPGVLTPDTARARARHERAAVGDGEDPSGARQQKRRESTVATVADRYVTEHVAAHNRPSTAAEVRRIVETKIKPGLGAQKIGDLTRADVKRWHEGMKAAPYEANRALAYLSKMMSLAVNEWELRGDNPCVGIRRFPERRRERYFTDDELGRIGEALAVAERAAPGTNPRSSAQPRATAPTPCPKSETHSAHPNRPISVTNRSNIRRPMIGFLSSDKRPNRPQQSDPPRGHVTGGRG